MQLCTKYFPAGIARYLVENDEPFRNLVALETLPNMSLEYVLTGR